MDSDADSILNTINQNYNSLNEKVRNTSFHPTVVTEVPYKEVWYVPGGKSYMAALLKDAGANYLWADDQHEGSLALSFEQVFKKAVNADFWLNVQHCKTINEVENYDSRNKKFKAFLNRNIYNNDLRNTKSGAFAYWETGLISPDELLADLISIFHPELLPNRQFRYYRKLN